MSDYDAEAARHRPLGRAGMGEGRARMGEERRASMGERREERRESLLAGIGEGRTAEGRVAEWRRHVG